MCDSACPQCAVDFERLGQVLPLSQPQFPCLQHDQLLSCHPETWDTLPCGHLLGTLMWEGRRGSMGGIHTGTPGITAGTADTEATCCRDGPLQVSQPLPNLLLDKGHSPEAF